MRTSSVIDPAPILFMRLCRCVLTVPSDETNCGSDLFVHQTRDDIVHDFALPITERVVTLLQIR